MRAGAVVVATLLGCASCKSAAEPTTKPGTAAKAGTAAKPRAKRATATSSAWIADLEALVSELANKHKNLYFKRSREQLKAKQAEIRRQLAKQDAAQAALSLAELVAYIGDAHTRLGLPKMARLPLALFAFDDGVAIIAAAEQHAELVGARVLQIGGKHIGQLLLQAMLYVPASNLAGRKLEAPRYVVLAPLLARLGALAPGASKARLTLQIGDRKRVVDIAMVQDQRSVRWRSVKLQRTPLRNQKQRFIYWNTYLADKNAVYFRYRRCAQMRGNPMTRFASGMLRFIDLEKVTRVIIDLRGNSGGNSRVLRPLITGLAARRQRLTIRVIVDRAVFSSALLNALELKQLAGAKIVGEPTSGKPNHYGEVRVFKLPRSKLPVQYSTKFFRKVAGDPPTLVPDVRVPQRASDLLAGKDLALEAALK